MTTGADVGLVGLAVMGQNLVLNLADNGYSVAVYNRTQATTDEFLTRTTPTQDVRATTSLEDLVDQLATPRKIILLVKAGGPVDAVLDDLVPLLDDGDIVIDGGNSLYTDTIRRLERLEAAGLRYVGAGVSGGEEGARHGPSIMPGGAADAWPHIATMLQRIAATAGPDDDEPCCDWIGPGGSGHYVKMIHNGIEYGDMQVLAEAYAVLSSQGIAPGDMAEIFARWNEGRLQSYLVEITADILAATADDGSPLIDLILDAAGQKGTGKWTVISAMELGPTHDAGRRGRGGAHGVVLRRDPGPSRGAVARPGDGDRCVAHRRRRRRRGLRGEADLLRAGVHGARRRVRHPRLGVWTWRRSPGCGAAGASSALRSSTTSHERSRPTPTSRTCCSTRSSSMPSPPRRWGCAEPWSPLRPPGSPSPRSRLR